MTRTERGTTLLLFPAGLLVIAILAALAVDSAAMFHAQRQVHRAAAQAADDAASMIDIDLLHRSSAVQLDAGRAERTARASLAAAQLPGRLIGAPTVEVDAVEATVVVTATIEVPHVLLGAVPRAGAPQRITARAIGQLDAEL